MQRFYRLRDDSQGFPGFPEFPAGNRDESIRIQVLEIFLECLDRVEIVFTQGKCAGSSCGPGIYQCHLHNIKLFLRATDIRASITDMDIHAWTLIEMISIVSVTFAHDVVHDQWIDLNTGNIRTSIGNGAHYVHAASRSDNCEAATR